jgi:hypothetical protein
MDIRKRGTTASFDFMPYLLQGVNCSSWLLYGFHRGIMSLIANFVNNCLGLSIVIVTLVAFRCYVTEARVRRRFNLAVSSSMALTGLLGGLSFTILPANDCADTFCWYRFVVIVCNCVLFVGPVLALGLSFRTRSVEFLPLSLGLGTLSSALPWTIYGFCINDPTAYGPNLLGLVLCMCQIMGYLIIRLRGPPDARDCVGNLALADASTHKRCETCVCSGCRDVDVSDVSTCTGSDAGGQAALSVLDDSLNEGADGAVGFKQAAKVDELLSAVV